MTEKLTTILTGTAGAGAIEAVQHVNLDSLQQGAGIIMQIIIGIATLIGLFKKKKT